MFVKKVSGKLLTSRIYNLFSTLCQRCKFN